MAGCILFSLACPIAKQGCISSSPAYAVFSAIISHQCRSSSALSALLFGVLLWARLLCSMHGANVSRERIDTLMWRTQVCVVTVQASKVTRDSMLANIHFFRARDYTEQAGISVTRHTCCTCCMDSRATSVHLSISV